jgi:predicted  nucleic acid-binding Zn-ribbon protein
MVDSDMPPQTLRIVQSPIESVLANDLDALRRKLSNKLDAPPRPALTSAINLLSMASTALEALEKRNVDIENCAIDAIRQLKSQLASSESAIAAYQERLRAAEDLAVNLNKMLSAAERRAVQAEERATRVESELGRERARADAAEARASRAEADAIDAENCLSQVSDLINSNLAGATSVLDNLGTARDPVTELKKKMFS